MAVSRQEFGDGSEVLGRHVVTSGTLRLIQNGVDTERFVPGQIERDSALIVCIGRLSRQKGQDRLLRALATMPSGRAVLVGDGPDRAELEELARSLRLEDRVTFTGTTDPLPHLHRAAVVAIPSRWEGLSIAMLEAMAVGALVVHTRFGGADVLEGAGIVADGDSEDEIVKALSVSLRRALSGSPELDELRCHARTKATRDHSLQAVNRRYVALWERVGGAQRTR